MLVKCLTPMEKPAWMEFLQNEQVCKWTTNSLDSNVKKKNKVVYI